MSDNIAKMLYIRDSDEMHHGGVSAHQPREGFMAPTFRIFVRTAEGKEFQAFTWCRDEASGIARAWREGVEFGHDVAAVWAEAI